MLENLRLELQNRVTSRRYIHTLGVEEMAVNLSRKYELDEKKVRISAVLHDIAKNMSVEELESICREKFKDELTEEDIKVTEILHGFVGAWVAENEFGIKDRSILDAIKYHTIGKKDLDVLGRIIYIADAIEKNRDYPGVEEIRSRTLEDLDAGIIFEINHKINYLEKIGGKIHRNTIEMRDELEMKRR